MSLNLAIIPVNSPNPSQLDRAMHWTSGPHTLLQRPDGASAVRILLRDSRSASGDPTVTWTCWFAPQAKPSLVDVASIEQELSALLAGRRVDVRTAEDLSRYFRNEVVRKAEVEYESE